MKKFRSFRILAGFAMLVAPCFASRAAAATSAEMCASSKLTAASRYATCRWHEARVSVLHGTATDLTACDQAYSDAWSAAEAKYGSQCPATGDELLLQQLLADYTSGVAGELLTSRTSK